MVGFSFLTSSVPRVAILPHFPFEERYAVGPVGPVGGALRVPSKDLVGAAGRRPQVRQDPQAIFLGSGPAGWPRSDELNLGQPGVSPPRWGSSVGGAMPAVERRSLSERSDGPHAVPLAGFFARAFASRSDGPFSSILWAPWISRSQIASARVASPIASCHCLTGSWLVTRVEARS